MTQAEIEGKALGLLAPVTGAERAAALVERVGRLETIGSVLELRPLLQA